MIKSRPSLTMICDLQFGSTGKGLLAGYLAKQQEPDAVATAWMPNAGHTFIDSDGTRYVHTMLANGVVSKSVEKVFIGPGSVINPQALSDECMPFIADTSRELEFFIHPNAVIVTDEHREAEKALVKIGSTMKGSAEAVIQKLRRDPNNMNTAAIRKSDFELGAYVRSIEEYNNAIDSCKHIQIEGAQGFSLGVSNGFYPYTTSRECTPTQILTDCAIPYYRHSGPVVNGVWGTMRTFPIRVANRYDENGKQIGTSGPCYSDQFEIDWSSIGQEPELTTVTKLPRRIFTFSMQQMRQALRMTRCNFLFLNFVNYLPSETRTDFMRMINWIAHDYGCCINLIGFGPTVNDIIECSTDPEDA